MKFALIFATVLMCSPKLSVLSFEEQLDYPGVRNGTTHVNYFIKIDNPKKKTIEVEAIWVKGKQLRFTQKEFSGDPILVNVSDVWQNPEVTTTQSPSKKESDLGVVKFHVKGKSKTRYLGIEIIIKIAPIARP
jgi:hypothetical protein